MQYPLPFRPRRLSSGLSDSLRDTARTQQPMREWLGEATPFPCNEPTIPWLSGGEGESMVIFYGLLVEMVVRDGLWATVNLTAELALQVSS